MSLNSIQEICKAISEGKDIQWSYVYPYDEWQNLQQYDPRFIAIDLINKKYRIKPKTEIIKYRRYAYKYNDNFYIWTVNSIGLIDIAALEKNPLFIKWLDTDWQEVEV